MIDPLVVAEVRRLLSLGWSQRKIAKKLYLEVSKGTIGRIANGKRPDYPSGRFSDEGNPDLFGSGPPKRCPHCGALIYGHCVKLMAELMGSKKPPKSNGWSGELNLQLNKRHRRRYRKLRFGPAKKRHN